MTHAVDSAPNVQRTVRRVSGNTLDRGSGAKRIVTFAERGSDANGRMRTELKLYKVSVFSDLCN
jgi:hypothetical protein